MKVGEIDVPGSIVNLEFRVGTLERIIEYISKNNTSVKLPTPKELEDLRNEAIGELQKKYPNSGISR